MKGLFRRFAPFPLLCGLLFLAVIVSPVFSAIPDDTHPELLVWHYGESEIPDQEALWREFRNFLGREPESDALTSSRVMALEEIFRILGPGIGSHQAFEESLSRLRALSRDPLAAQSGCPDLLDAVTRASGALQRRASLPAEEAALLRQKETLSWNVATERRRLAENSVMRKGRGQHQPSPLIGSTEEALKLQQVTAEIQKMETDAAEAVRRSQRELQELSVTLIRRGDYREAILAARFYRTLFGELMVTLRVDRETAEVLMPEGISPTLHDVEGVARRSLEFVDGALSDTLLLLKSGVVAGAASKLAGVYAMGRRMPEFLCFPEGERKKILQFLDLQRDLKRQLAEGDPEAASLDLLRIRTLARDFDCTSPEAELNDLKSSRAHRNASSGSDSSLNGKHELNDQNRSAGIPSGNESGNHKGLDGIVQLVNHGPEVTSCEVQGKLRSNSPGHPVINASSEWSAGVFSRRINRARLLEADQPVDALIIYLDLRNSCPGSRLAREGVERMCARLMGLPGEK